jgi:AcrR family transcriptional regulator
MPKVSESYLVERREQILQAALSCFGRKGFHQTTMRDICDEAGVSPGAVYRYFRSKDEFIKAASAEYAERLQDLISQVTATASDAKEGLHRIGAYYYGYFHDEDFFEQARADAEVHVQSLRDPEIQAAAQAMLSSTRDAFASLIDQAGSPESRDNGVSADTIANLVISLWFGLQYTKALDPEHVDTDAVFALVQTLLSALAEGRVPAMQTT